MISAIDWISGILTITRPLVSSAPFVAGTVIALVLWKRNPRVALLTLAGCALTLVSIIGRQAFFRVWASIDHSLDQSRVVYGLLDIVQGLLYLGTTVLLVLAVLTVLRARREPPRPPAG